MGEDHSHSPRHQKEEELASSDIISVVELGEGGRRKKREDPSCHTLSFLHEREGSW